MQKELLGTSCWVAFPDFSLWILCIKDIYIYIHTYNLFFPFISQYIVQKYFCVIRVVMTGRITVWSRQVPLHSGSSKVLIQHDAHKHIGDGFIKRKARHPTWYQDHKVHQLWNLFQHILTFLYFTDKGNDPRNYRPPALGEWKMKGCFASNVMPDSWLNRQQCQASPKASVGPHLLLTTACHGVPKPGKSVLLQDI